MVRMDKHSFKLELDIGVAISAEIEENVLSIDHITVFILRLEVMGTSSYIGDPLAFLFVGEDLC